MKRLLAALAMTAAATAALAQDEDPYLWLEDIFGESVTAPIHTNVKISEAPFHFKTVLEYDPESRGAKNFQALVNRIIQDNHRGAQAV